MSLGLTESLPSLVKSKYATAKATGALTFAASELTTVRVGSVPFQLRYCPSLAKKPNQSKSNPTSDEARKKTSDPFENPSSDLHVADVPQLDPSHLIILNKFPIIPNHFILATKANKPQTYFLERDDIWLTYSCLKSWEASGGGKLFAFFNSGEHSGASQPHRHVQFLPVEDMSHGDESGEWSLLADDAFQRHGWQAQIPAGLIFPFRHDYPFQAFGVRLAASLAAAELHRMYKNLYQAAFGGARKDAGENDVILQIQEHEHGTLPMSYNLAMTTTSMILCARRSEGKMVHRADGSDIDYVALNGTLLGGTLMVKNEELFKRLKDEPDKLEEVLRTVGIPNDQDASLSAL